MDVPAGFRQSSSLQKDFHQFLPPSKDSSSDQKVSLLSHITSNDSITLPSDGSTDLQHELQPTAFPVPNSSFTKNVPILRCVDKCSSSLPSRLTFTEDFIRSSVGFRRIDSLKNHLKDLYQDTIRLDSLTPDTVLDLGDLATIKKSARNTTPVPRPNAFGDVMHMDIVFGPDVSLGNIHYGLLFTDRFSRMTYIYPLQNLTTDIRRQLESFFCAPGFYT